MEVIVTDFRKPIKQNSQPSTKTDSFKAKDFSSTLESVNKKSISNDSTKDTSKYNEDKKDTISNKSEVTKENSEINSEQIKEDDEKKDYSLVYGNVMYFFNNVADIEDDSKSNKEIELNIINDSKPVALEKELEYKLEIDNDTNEILLENNIIDSTIRKDETSKEINTREFDLTYVAKEINDDSEENKLNNKGLQLNSKMLQIEIDEGKSEELSTSNETNLSYIEHLDEKMEFSSEQKNNSKSSLFEQKLNNTEVENTDKNIEVNDEAFITMDKNGIRFVKDSINELDKPDNINRKEVIQQIVDKVKIDLSNSKNEITVRLKPEVLGEMTMDIEVIKGAVTAKIMVDNQRTKEIIEGNLIQLKEGIKDTGLEIKTVEVFVGNNSDFDKHNSGQFNFKQSNKRIKIKSQDNKVVNVYGEQPMENGTNTNESYLANSLNLFA